MYFWLTKSKKGKPNYRKTLSASEGYESVYRQKINAQELRTLSGFYKNDSCSIYGFHPQLFMFNHFVNRRFLVYFSIF